MRALKLFAISFISAALVFGLVAYLIINNSFKQQESSETSDGNSESSETEFTLETKPGGEIDIPESVNTSVSFIFIGTVYQPDVFDDYDYSEYNESTQGFPMKERGITVWK